MSKNKKVLEGEPMKEIEVLENLETEIDRARQELEKTKVEIEEKKHEMGKISSRTHSEEELEITKKQVANSVKGGALKEKIERQKAYDNQMITGRFMNLRAPGQPAKLTYMKYADDPVKWYNFEDRKTYTIPRGFVDQINEYYHTPRFIQKNEPMDPDAPSSQIHDVDTSNKKYAFVPLGFNE